MGKFIDHENWGICHWDIEKLKLNHDIAMGKFVNYEKNHGIAMENSLFEKLKLNHGIAMEN